MTGRSAGIITLSKFAGNGGRVDCGLGQSMPWDNFSYLLVATSQCSRSDTVRLVHPTGQSFWHMPEETPRVAARPFS